MVPAGAYGDISLRGAAVCIPMPASALLIPGLTNRDDIGSPHVPCQAGRREFLSRHQQSGIEPFDGCYQRAELSPQFLGNCHLYIWNKLP
jgi:hypothetical protein